MEILTLQNDLHLKIHQSAANLCCLVDTEKYKGVCTAAMKVASLFCSTYLCESAFSDMNFVKNKHRTRLTCCTSARLTQSCSVKLYSRVQYIGCNARLPTNRHLQTKKKKTPTTLTQMLNIVQKVLFFNAKNVVISTISIQKQHCSLVTFISFHSFKKLILKKSDKLNSSICSWFVDC